MRARGPLSDARIGNVVYAKNRLPDFVSVSRIAGFAEERTIRIYEC